MPAAQLQEQRKEYEGALWKNNLRSSETFMCSFLKYAPGFGQLSPLADHTDVETKQTLRSNDPFPGLQDLLPT